MTIQWTINDLVKEAAKSDASALCYAKALEYLGITYQAFSYHLGRGTAPRFVAFGEERIFLTSDLDAWLQSKKSNPGRKRRVQD